jgi:hypothetical protein
MENLDPEIRNEEINTRCQFLTAQISPFHEQGKHKTTQSNWYNNPRQVRNMSGS